MRQELHDAKAQAKAKEKQDIIDWHTGECLLWMNNDYGFYWKFIRAKSNLTPQRMKNMWMLHGPKGKCNVRRVDWNEVARVMVQE